MGTRARVYWVEYADTVRRMRENHTRKGRSDRQVWQHERFDQLNDGNPWSKYDH